jgi:hypothetical protein
MACAREAASGYDGLLAQAATAAAGVWLNRFHSQGRSSCSRFGGIAAMRAKTSASQACGSTSLSLAVMTAAPDCIETRSMRAAFPNDYPFHGVERESTGQHR